MKQLAILTTIYFLILFGQLYGQDTTSYHQENAALFSNSYTFIKSGETDDYGRFYHIYSTDDLQSWYGRGTFKETKTKIYLTYDTVNCSNRVETTNNIDHSDTLYIKWLNCMGKKETYLFRIGQMDTIQNKVIYYLANQKIGVVKIPKSDLHSNHFSLSTYHSITPLFNFEIPINSTEVSIILNYLPLYIMEQISDILYKNGENLIVEDDRMQGKAVKLTPYRK